MRSWARIVALGVWGMSASACAASPSPDPSSPGAAESRPEASTTASPLSGARKRLQGRWEITRYQSDRPIPKEALPIMGELFDSLRMRFEGSKLTIVAGKSTEETTDFDVTEEPGDAFQMVVKGGMFDGAHCHFLADDTFEVVDKGASWPGVSTIKRTH